MKTNQNSLDIFCAEKINKLEEGASFESLRPRIALRKRRATKLENLLSPFPAMIIWGYRIIQPF